MGISKFYGQVISKIDGVIHRRLPSSISSLSFDLNSLIHTTAQYIYSYGEYDNESRREYIKTKSKEELRNEHFEFLFNKIKEIVTFIHPLEYLVIAIDGVAPLAKLKQQRQRRYRNADSKNSSDFDPTCITPGTQYMRHLDKYLRENIDFESQVIGSLFPKNVIYSSHMVPGEAEHKIFELFRNGTIESKSTHVVYGLDADLIILSMLSPIKHIVLMRDFDMDNRVEQQYLYIDEVRNHYKKIMKHKTAVDDFAVLTFLLGNDFLPLSPVFYDGDMSKNVEFLIDCYNEVGLPLTNPQNSEINITTLKRLFRVLSRYEEKRLRGVYRYMKDEDIKFSIFHDTVQEMGKELKLNMKKINKIWNTKIIYPNPEKTELRKLSFDVAEKIFTSSESNVIECVEHYVTGLLWNYLYYKQGTDFINQSYMYPYFYAPMLIDIYQYFPISRGPISKEENQDNIVFNPILQMLSVLPPQSKKFVPLGAKEFYDMDSPLFDIFPHKVKLDLDGFKDDTKGKGIVLVSNIPAKRVWEYRDEIMKNIQKAEIYKNQDNLYYEKRELITLDGSIKYNKIIHTSAISNPKEEDPKLSNMLDATTKVTFVKLRTNAKSYRKNISEPYFSLIKSGKKIVEGRLNDGDWALMKKGDIINFISDKNEELQVQITSIGIYDTFADMLKSEGLDNVLPNKKTIQEGVRLYYGFEDYKEREKEFGVLGIEFVLIQ